METKVNYLEIKYHDVMSVSIDTMVLSYYAIKQGQLANDATSSVYDYYLRRFLSVAWLMNHFSTFLIGWSRDS